MTKFQTELLSHIKAGIHVLFVRTRELDKTCEEIRNLSVSQSTAIQTKDYFQWSSVSGWKTLKTAVNADGVAEAMLVPHRPTLTDLHAALKEVNDVANSGKNKWNQCYMTVQFPHAAFVAGVAGRQLLIQLTFDYAIEFASTHQVLIFVVPEGFVPPSELAHQVSILDYPLPSKEDLAYCLDHLIGDFGAQFGQINLSRNSVAEFCRAGSGMNRFEFISAASRALRDQKPVWPSINVQEVARRILMIKTDIIKQSEVLEMMPDARLEDVGGLDVVKEWVTMRKVCFTKEARDFGVVRPRGVLLVGAQGCGKSLFARVVGAIFGMPVIRFNIQRVFNSLVGSSEQRMEQALKTLKSMAPVVVLVDEIDKAGLSVGNTSGSDVGQKLLGILLTTMQEATEELFIIFTANRVGTLPPELLRKGRLDQCFAALPPNRRERLEIMKIHLAKKNQRTNIDLSEAVNGSEDYIAAELESAVADAVLDAYLSKRAVDAKDIVKHLHKMNPLSKAFPEDFKAIKDWARNNALESSLPDDAAPLQLVAQATISRRRSIEA